MDLATENRLAALLMEEATKLRMQAEEEGVHVYLRQPQVRGRPNSRFLTATVLGVQQANRTAEVNEMWRVRKKELELDEKLMGISRDKGSDRSSFLRTDYPEGSSRRREVDKHATDSCGSRKRASEDCNTDEDSGLRDDEVEEFLHSRVKRGRGAIGSRMDEPGPFLPSSSSDSKGKFLVNHEMRVVEEWEQRVLGPEKPSFLKSCKTVDESVFAHNRKDVQKTDVVSSKKGHTKLKSKKGSNKLRDEKRKEKRSKHRCHSR
ncbi:uncharacterized protein LOC131225630 isoform X1 [Magnolia sinica]|uniref:uncharacterized protein LOC131225630 isoform X1 n=1 Tax=Magnolia sinica TaxID=86752 RepID=UPI002659C444|nr:uncharacterized protein LOC131225630 isoform X1 [Magnolia sinica]